MKSPAENYGWEKRFEGSMHEFIVQPSERERCSVCGSSGTRSVEIENGERKAGFVPALAYIKTEKLKTFISQELFRARKEAWETVCDEFEELMLSFHSEMPDGQKVLETQGRIAKRLKAEGEKTSELK